MIPGACSSYRRHRPLRAALAAISLLPPLLLSGGCYNYVPAESPRPGTEVRAHFSTEGAIRYSGRRDIPVMHVDGVLVRETPDSLLLDILIARDQSEFSRVEIRDTVMIRRADLQSLLVREMSTTRSILFVGAAGVGAVLLVQGFKAITGGSEGEGEPGGPILPAVAPAFSLRLNPPALLRFLTR
jgi:hypothetical protein